MESQDRPRPFRRLLAVFAHPDDESFTSGGVFGALRHQGIEITLICATKGEAGEISSPELGSKETLGEVREAELRAAMAEVDVHDIRFLGYRDSGMAGSAENQDPRSLAQADEEVVAQRIAALIDELQPDIVLTFGPEGVYWHPDHLVIHRATARAVTSAIEDDERWRPDEFFYTTIPREWIIKFATRPESAFEYVSVEELNRMGVPRAEICHIFDITPFLEQKRSTMAAHKTQFGVDGPFEGEPRDVVDDWLRYEHFIPAGVPWKDELPEDDLLTNALSSAGVTRTSNQAE